MGNNNNASNNQKPVEKPKIERNPSQNENVINDDAIEKQKRSNILKSQNQKIIKRPNIEKKINPIEEIVAYRNFRRQINNCKLNIYVYSNQRVDNSIKQLLNDFKNPIIKCEIEIIDGKFSKENSNYLINKFKEDSKNKSFKNVVIIPITSIGDFGK